LAQRSGVAARSEFVRATLPQVVNTIRTHPPMQTVVCLCHVIDSLLVNHPAFLCAGWMCECSSLLPALVRSDRDFHCVTPPNVIVLLNYCWPHCMTWRILRFSSRKRAASASASLIVKRALRVRALCRAPSSTSRWLRGGVPAPPRRFHQLFQLLTLPTPPSDGVYRSSHTVAELSRHSFVPAGPTVLSF
jgi:hypothetical protein